jgi:hypothetical protein
MMASLAGRKPGSGSLLPVLGLPGIISSAPACEPGVIEIDRRRELFVDDFLVDGPYRLELRLQ